MPGRIFTRRLLPASRCASARQARRAFTLIELLIVIGIVAVLLTILLTAMSKARQQASRAKCLGNLRQIITASLSYTVDNDGQLPFCGWYLNTDDNGSYGYSWLFADRAHRGNVSWVSPHPPRDGVQTGQLWPYLRKIDVYHCPSELEDNAKKSIEWMSAYLMNSSQNGHGSLGTTYTNSYGLPPQPGVPGVRISRVKSYGERVLYWEAEDAIVLGWEWNDGAALPTAEYMSDRHYKGSNLAFLDGHAEWWHPDTWKHWATGPGSTTTGPLWWNPLTGDGH